MPRLTVQPEAELDALDAGSWYEGERAGRRFPFGVFFIVEAERALVLAITHLRRHPSVWQRRA